MGSNNINSQAKIIKADSNVQPYELGNFISNGSNQNEGMGNSAILNNKSING